MLRYIELKNLYKIKLLIWAWKTPNLWVCFLNKIVSLIFLGLLLNNLQICHHVASLPLSYMYFYKCNHRTICTVRFVIATCWSYIIFRPIRDNMLEWQMKHSCKVYKYNSISSEIIINQHGIQRRRSLACALSFCSTVCYCAVFFRGRCKR